MTSPAGWYPDPSGKPMQRYFDGADWTENYAAAAVSAIAPPRPAVPSPTSPPRKHMSTGRVIAIIVAFFVGLVVIVALQSIGHRKESEADTRSTGEHGTQAAAPAGSVVRDGKFAFQVKDINRSVVGGDPSNPYMRVKAQGVFIILTVAVQNIGNEPQSYFGQNQKLIDTAGNKYSTTTTADMYANSAMGDVNPGNTIQVLMSFDVPDGTVASELEVHDSLLSGGTRVAIVDPRGK